MKIDINVARAVSEAQAKLIRWDLTIALDGKDYRVRPLTNADLVAIGSLGVVRKVEDATDVLLSLFESEKPPLASVEEVADVIVAITIGWQEHLKKKSSLRAEAMRSQISPGST